MPFRCFVPGCRTGYSSDVAERKKEGKCNLSLFKPPKDPYLFELWKKAIPRADKTLGPKSTLCELHFRKEDIQRYWEIKLPNGYIQRIFRASKRLKVGSIPRIFKHVPGHSSYVEKREKKLRKTHVKRKKKLQSSNKEQGSKRAKISRLDNEANKNSNSSLKTEKENVLMEVIVVQPLSEESPTTKPSRLKKRQNSRKSVNSSFSDSEKHAVSEPESSASYLLPAPDAITDNSCRLNVCNGILLESSTQDKLTNNCIDLNSSSTGIIEYPVPDTLTDNYSKQNTSNVTITDSSLPDALKDRNVCDITMTEHPLNDAISDDNSSRSKADKTMKDFFSAETVGNNAVPDICDTIGSELSNISSDSDKGEQTSFDFIKASVDMFDTGNSWWRVNTFDDFIAFSRWTPGYTVERRIVITSDLAVKVFLMDKETKIGQGMKNFSVYDIARLIYSVENLKLCSGINKENSNCAGYLHHAFICRKNNLCLNCIKWSKEEKKKALKRLKESSNCIELLNFNYIP